MLRINRLLKYMRLYWLKWVCEVEMGRRLATDARNEDARITCSVRGQVIISCIIGELYGSSGPHYPPCLSFYYSYDPEVFLFKQLVSREKRSHNANLSLAELSIFGCYQRSRVSINKNADRLIALVPCKPGSPDLLTPHCQQAV